MEDGFVSRHAIRDCRFNRAPSHTTTLCRPAAKPGLQTANPRSHRHRMHLCFPVLRRIYGDETKSLRLSIPQSRVTAALTPCLSMPLPKTPPLVMIGLDFAATYAGQGVCLAFTYSRAGVTEYRGGGFAILYEHQSSCQNFAPSTSVPDPVLMDEFHHLVYVPRQHALQRMDVSSEMEPPPPLQARRVQYKECGCSCAYGTHVDPEVHLHSWWPDHEGRCNWPIYP